jgi:hypothetical protein
MDTQTAHLLDVQIEAWQQQESQQMQQQRSPLDSLLLLPHSAAAAAAAAGSQLPPPLQLAHLPSHHPLQAPAASAAAALLLLLPAPTPRPDQHPANHLQTAETSYCLRCGPAVEQQVHVLLLALQLGSAAGLLRVQLPLCG